MSESPEKKGGRQADYYIDSQIIPVKGEKAQLVLHIGLAANAPRQDMLFRSLEATEMPQGNVWDRISLGADVLTGPATSSILKKMYGMLKAEGRLEYRTRTLEEAELKRLLEIASSHGFYVQSIEEANDTPGFMDIEWTKGQRSRN